MKCTAVDLRDFFLTYVQRFSQSAVTVNTSYENKHITVQRRYNGPAKNHQIMKDAVNSEILPEHMYPGSIGLDMFDICTFLNMAWEEIHNARCLEISQHVMDQTHHPGPVDPLLPPHGELLRQSPLYQETDTSDAVMGMLTYRQERTSPSSKIFKMGKEMTQYGRPCVINATLEGFTASIMGGETNPDISRMVRFVNTAELSTFITLAENSRYSAGVLGRVRVWNDTKGMEHDVIEVFYNDQRSTWLPFWYDRSLYLTIYYVQYPAPLDVEDITGTDDQGNKLNENQLRIIECDYPMMIAEVAANKVLKLASG